MWSNKACVPPRAYLHQLTLGSYKVGILSIPESVESLEGQLGALALGSGHNVLPQPLAVDARISDAGPLVVEILESERMKQRMTTQSEAGMSAGHEELTSSGIKSQRLDDIFLQLRSAFLNGSYFGLNTLVDAKAARALDILYKV